MPNRIIREGWLDSARIDGLDAQAERFFLRLLLRADDFGRYSANPVVLKNTLFPLKEEIRVTDSSRWLAACEKAGLVRCYESPKGRFLEVREFNQRTRAASSKYPSPEESVQNASQADDGHMSDKGPSSAHVFVVGDVDVVGDGTRKAARSVGQQLPDELQAIPGFSDLWARWERHRREIRKPLTPEATAQQLKKLCGLQEGEAAAAIERSIANGWQGLFPSGTRPPEAVPEWRRKQHLQDRLQEIEDRTPRGSAGPAYTPEDREEKRKLEAELKHMKASK